MTKTTKKTVKKSAKKALKKGSVATKRKAPAKKRGATGIFMGFP
jgi:hypothetical protein